MHDNVAHWDYHGRWSHPSKSHPQIQMVPSLVLGPHCAKYGRLTILALSSPVSRTQLGVLLRTGPLSLRGKSGPRGPDLLPLSPSFTAWLPLTMSATLKPVSNHTFLWDLNLCSFAEGPFQLAFSYSVHCKTYFLPAWRTFFPVLWRIGAAAAMRKHF